MFCFDEVETRLLMYKMEQLIFKPYANSFYKASTRGAELFILTQFRRPEL